MAPQNIPHAISVLTLGNKVILYCIRRPWSCPEGSSIMNLAEPTTFALHRNAGDKWASHASNSHTAPCRLLRGDPSPVETPARANGTNRPPPVSSTPPTVDRRRQCTCCTTNGVRTGWCPRFRASPALFCIPEATYGNCCPHVSEYISGNDCVLLDQNHSQHR